MVAALTAVVSLALHPAACARTMTAESLAAPGHFAVGLTTLTLVDSSRPTAASGAFPGSAVRTLPTEVYYPAVGGTPGAVTRGAPLDSAAGPFPLLVFAHGLGGSRANFASVLAHFASRGWIAVAPDFPLTNTVTLLTGTTSLADLANQPGDVSFEIDTFTGRGSSAGGEFVAAVDGRRVALFGHSYGGATALLTAFGGPLVDSRIKAAAALAPFSCPFGPAMFTRRLPFLLAQGTSDLIVDPEWSRELFPGMASPKLFIEIIGGDHVGFDPSLGGIRDRDVLGFFGSRLQDGLPGGQAAQGLALAAALAAVPGADFTRCLARGTLPDANAPRDPLIVRHQEENIAEVALTAFFEGFVRPNAVAKRFVAGFRHRAHVERLVRFCGKKGRRTCRSVQPAPAH